MSQALFTDDGTEYGTYECLGCGDSGMLTGLNLDLLRHRRIACHRCGLDEKGERQFLEDTTNAGAELALLRARLGKLDAALRELPRFTVSGRSEEGPDYTSSPRIKLRQHKNKSGSYVRWTDIELLLDPAYLAARGTR